MEWPTHLMLVRVGVCQGECSKPILSNTSVLIIINCFTLVFNGFIVNHI